MAHSLVKGMKGTATHGGIRLATIKKAGRQVQKKGEGTFLMPGSFCEKMNSAWKGVEVKDTFLPGTFMKR